MNDNILKEVTLLMTVNSVCGTEQVKIISIIGRLLDSEPYIKLLSDSMNKVVNSPDYSAADFSKLLLIIIDINKLCNFYKEITVERMKYVIYGVLYSYFLKFQTLKIEQIDMSDFRLNYLNSIELVLLIPETIKIKKEDCLSCLGRTFNCLNFLNDKTHVE